MVLCAMARSRCLVISIKQLLIYCVILLNLPAIKSVLEAVEGEFRLLDGYQKAAEIIRNNINQTAEPCDDFYNFSCGGFVDKAKLPVNKTIVTPLTEVEDRVLREIKNLLEAEVDIDEPRTFSLVKNFYRACVDLRAIEEKGEKPLMGILEKLGGWPVVVGDSWDESNFDWVKTDTLLEVIGFNPKYIFNIFVRNDVYNAKKNILYIDPLIPHISISALKSGLSDSVTYAYYHYFADVAEYLGADKDYAIMEAKEAVTFERSLVQAISKRAADPKIKIKSIKELKDIIPDIPWSEYLNSLSEPVLHLNDEDEVKVINLHYLLNVKNLLKQSPKRVIANYIIWRAVADSIPHLNSNLLKIYRKFVEDSTGRQTHIARSTECINMLSEKTGLTVGVSSLYIRKYFSNSTMAAVKPILHAIFDEFQNTIKQNDWMDPITKGTAVRKSEFMKKIIAYPDELLDDETIDNYTRKLEISSSDHFGNILNIRRFHFDYSISGLHESTNERLWVILSDSTVINAYYYVLNNAFVVLAAILQPPIFHEDWPDYMKFGSIGFIIGHEMMHAYDWKNKHYDETGSFRPWLSEKSKDIYREKILCFVEQYEKYRDDVFGLKVNGTLTINENLADAVGLAVSHNAYKRWIQNNKKVELPLTGLNYTPDQIFWIASINFLCTKMTDQHRMDLFFADVHTPSDFRTIGTLSNSYSFPKSFACKEGSLMNPKKKCRVW